jgi:hypothetical protein
MAHWTNTFNEVCGAIMSAYMVLVKSIVYMIAIDKTNSYQSATIQAAGVRYHSLGS